MVSSLEPDWSKVLSNPQHEKFAQLVADGRDAKDSYRLVYPKCKIDSAEASGARLLGIVKSRISWIQSQSATATTLSISERREFLARVVRLNLCDFEASKHGDLISSIDRIDGSEGEAGILKMRVDSKRACIMSDAELAGEVPDKPSASLTVNVGVQVNVMTPERRKELQEKKRAALEQGEAQRN